MKNNDVREYEPNTQGPVIGELHGKDIIAWYVNHLGEKWDFDRAAVFDPPGSGCVDLDQLRDSEVMRAPGLIYRCAGKVAEKVPEVRHAGHCSCGQAVIKIEHADRRTMSTNGIVFVYPESSEGRSEIFRCRSCREEISESWQPDN
ncbi:hypothetical protein [Chromobacterium haemolyticum]|uniref:hypothetical protein n=1 Tax=Chromobacterium haemolyticum TaxID=394935 RepID=UPI002449D51A|nr:hypothetical protein [Chromobacterium haemolyticum]MDH0342130.1 hypothetical protein [Chromobacterium haemolyticum]